MQASKIQQIEFSNKCQLKALQGVFKIYAFQGMFFRFSFSSIIITKINGANQFQQVTLNNDDIAKEFSRLKNGIYVNNCEIISVFPQQEKIYMIIQAEESFYLVEIKICEAIIDPQLSNIFHEILRIQNPNLFHQSLEKSIISYRFFDKNETRKNDIVVILFKHQQRQTFNLLRGKIKQNSLEFYQAFSDKSFQEDEVIQFIYCTQNQFTFISRSGGAKVYDASKRFESYILNEKMKQIVKYNKGIKNIHNNSKQQKIVASYQTSSSLFYLLLVNSSTNRYLLIKWTKGPEFLNTKNCKIYQIKINIDQDLTNLSCLQQLDKFLLILWQRHHYYLFQINNKDTKLYKIKVQSEGLDGVFGIHNNMIIFFEQNSFYNCTYEKDQQSSQLKFSTSKHRKKLIQGKDSSDLTNKSQQFKKNNQNNPEIRKPNHPHVQEHVEDHHQFRDQSLQHLEKRQHPIIIKEGNNRLSKSKNQEINQVLSQDDQSNKILNSSSRINQYNKTQDLSNFQPSFPNPSHNFFHNIPPVKNDSNPFDILKDKFNLDRQTAINQPNSGLYQQLLREKDYISFNPSQITANFVNNFSQQNQHYSFGVPPIPPIQKKQQPIPQTTIQLPSLERGFSFGNHNQSQNVSKKPNLKVDSNKHIITIKKLADKIVSQKKFIIQELKCIKNMNEQLKNKSLQGIFSLDLQKQQMENSNLLHKAMIQSQKISIERLQEDKKRLQQDFELSYEVLSHNINKKIHEYELNQIKKNRKKQIFQQLKKKNTEKVRKNIISFKFKLTKLEQQLSMIFDCLNQNKQKQKISQSKNRSNIFQTS